MNFDLLGYNNSHHPVEINMDDVKRIDIQILSGDEVAIITHNDDSKGIIDPMAGARMVDFFDDEYTVLNKETGVNLLENSSWIGRTDSYDGCDISYREGVKADVIREEDNMNPVDVVSKLAYSYDYIDYNADTFTLDGKEYPMYEVYEMLAEDKNDTIERYVEVDGTLYRSDDIEELEGKIEEGKDSVDIKEIIKGELEPVKAEAIIEKLENRDEEKDNDSVDKDNKETVEPFYDIEDNDSWDQASID